MNREKQAHTQDGNNQHYIVQRIVRPSGGKQDQRQSDTDHERRNSVDFHNLTQANLKQPQDKAWLLIKRIGQQAVIAVHKKRLCKVRATVDSVHYKYKVRKPSHHDFVNDGFFFGQQIDACQHGGDKESAHIGNLLCRVPEYLFMPFDKQLIQILEALAVAANGSICGYFLFICLFDKLCLCRAVHLIGQSG